ncbi:methyltransferase domain-containing protein [Paenibacillus xylanexedens]|uniref:methyltransferase domain-containing protein n=1 Tax=Paenibacillus xylanexedens TaxID=528191 RepID=UPI003B01B8A6
MRNLRIDLGSGKNKHRNCTGVDRIAYPKTDIIHDINSPLPFEDNCATLVMCSHSLQYVDNLEKVMEEIYRICSHKAVVCIVAPYAHVSSHMVNPRFKQLFNEHMPQFWTSQASDISMDDKSPLYMSERLGLQKEDMESNIDFRLLNTEFFYFPSYHGLYNETELELLRQSQLNVAYQIMYHLLVVKQPISDAEVDGYQSSELLEEPDYIKEQRIQFQAQEGLEQPFYMEHLSPISRKEESPVTEEKLLLPKKSKRSEPATNRRLKSKRKSTIQTPKKKKKRI